MSETKTTEYILIALVAVSLIVSGLTYMSISPIAKNTKDLADSIEGIGDVDLSGFSDVVGDLSEEIDDLSTGVDAILTKLGEVVEPDEPDEPDLPDEPVEPVVLRIGYFSAPTDVDPPNYGDDFLNGIDQLVHESFFRMWYDESGEITWEPVLVEGYTRVDDLTWDFKLREGIYFSDGTEFDSQDAYWSLFRDDPRPSNQVWSTDARVASAEKLDKYTIRMTTKYPMNNLYAWFCQGWTNIVSYDWVVETDNLHNYPMIGLPPGTGPYMYTECESMLYTKMTLSPNWRGETADIPYTRRITDIEIYHAPDDTGRIMAFEAGSFEMAFPCPIEAIENLEASGFKIWVYPTPIVRQLQLNNAFEPTDDIRVRQAMAFGIKYDELITSIYGKYADRVRTCVPALGIGYRDYDYYDYDPAKARELIADYCNEKGIETPLKLTMWVTQGEDRDIEAATVLKSYFADIDIDLTLLLVESAAIRAETRDIRARYLAGEDVEFVYHINFRTWHTDTMWSGDDLYSLYYSTTSTNRWYLENSEIDRLSAITISDLPFEERLAANYECQDIWMQNCYGIPLYTAPYIYVTVPEFGGMIVEPNVYPWLGQAYFTE